MQSPPPQNSSTKQNNPLAEPTKNYIMGCVADGVERQKIRVAELLADLQLVVQIVDAVRHIIIHIKR